MGVQRRLQVTLFSDDAHFDRGVKNRLVHGIVRRDEARAWKRLEYGGIVEGVAQALNNEYNNCMKEREVLNGKLVELLRVE